MTSRGPREDYFAYVRYILLSICTLQISLVVSCSRLVCECIFHELQSLLRCEIGTRVVESFVTQVEFCFGHDCVCRINSVVLCSGLVCVCILHVSQSLQ